MKTHAKKDRDFIIDGVDFFIKELINLFDAVAEFLYHPKNKPTLRKRK